MPLRFALETRRERSISRISAIALLMSSWAAIGGEGKVRKPEWEL